MSRGVFIAGTDTGVGKTRVTVGLLHCLRGRGLPAAGMKPAVSDHNCSISDINPYCFDLPASPHIAAQQEHVTIEPQRIAAAYQALSHQVEVIVVEGTGGWFAPISEQRTMADIAQQLALPVVLVVGVRLGCLNHALLSQLAITQSGLAFAGWIGSVLEPDMRALDANLAALASRLQAPQLALLAHCPDRASDAPALARACAALFSGKPLSP